MTLLVDRIVDHRAQSDTGADPPYHPAFTNPVYVVSPNDRYIASALYTDPTLCVADTQTLTVVQNYNVGSLTVIGDLPLFVDGTDKIIFIDDTGSLWTSGQGAGGEVYEFPLNALDSPVLRFTMSGSDDFSTYAFGQKFILPDSTYRVILIASRTGDGHLPFDYHIWDGTTYTGETLSFVPFQAIQDDNSDIWICGVDEVFGGSVTTCYFKRITDVTGSSPYPADQTFTGLPDLPHDPVNANTTGLWGVFASGYFVGGWLETASRNTNGDGVSPSAQCSYLIRLKLDGSGTVQTAFISDAAPTGFSWGFPQRFIPVNSSYISLEVVDPGVSSQRKYGFYSTATLAKTADYDLSDWAAGDDLAAESPVDDVTINADAVGPTFLYTRQAFMTQSNGQGFFEPDNPDEPLQNVGKVWLYYLGDSGSGGGGGGGSDAVTVRAWAFILDGHEFYVLPSAGLVCDVNIAIATQGEQGWYEWKTEGQDYWRLVAGGNWQGMAGTLADGASDVVAGDISTGVLWRLDPTKGRDDLTDTGDEAFTRTVVGGVPLDGRDILPMGALQLTCAMGAPSQTGASFTVLMSDDLGKTWINCGSQAVVAGDYVTPIEFRGLGSAGQPGRIFKISDDGATPRIGRATLR